MKQQTFQAGMTLIELMIVVVILGIISSIALPNYFRYRERTNLAEAKTNIIQIYQYLARDKLANPRNYLTQAAYTGKINTLKNNLPAKQREKYTYTQTVVQPENSTAFYVYIQAAPTSGNGQNYLWADENGEVYKCSGTAGAVSGNKPSSCENY